MKKRRPHCSLLPDVEIPMPKLAVMRHFLLEEGMKTVEEGFSVTKTNNDSHGDVLISNYRGTELTEAEETKDGGCSTIEDVLHRALDELNGVEDPLVEAVKFLLNVIEHQDRVIKELTNKSKA